LNEPIVNALMCGKRGLWPPYLRGDGGYIRVMLQLARGIQATVEAIKEIDPLSIMVHVEATGLSRAIRQDLESLAVEEQRRGFLAYDLLVGSVTHDHPLFPWLIRSGASVDTLDEIARHKIPLDVLGMNFYPQWSTQHLYVDPKGRLAYRAHEEDGAGFAAVINDYYQRYRAPIIITETSAFGSEELRARWLKSSIESVKYLRGQRVPVLGYTWFPMFTMIDWRYRHSQSPLEHYRLELGLYRLNDDPAREGRWSATPLVEQMRGYIANSAESVGALDPSALAPALKTDACKAHSHETTHAPDAATAAFMRNQPQPELVEGD
jgi:beta-glucosidase/6-phospho-beta-glucosidase/beta-galactosidase